MIGAITPESCAHFLVSPSRFLLVPQRPYPLFRLRLRLQARHPSPIRMQQHLYGAASRCRIDILPHHAYLYPPHNRKHRRRHRNLAIAVENAFRRYNDTLTTAAPLTAPPPRPDSSVNFNPCSTSAIPSPPPPHSLPDRPPWHPSCSLNSTHFTCSYKLSPPL